MHIRISYDDSSEKDEALKLVKYLVKVLGSKYTVYASKKVYRNRKNSGGRIYINLAPKGSARS